MATALAGLEPAFAPVFEKLKRQDPAERWPDDVIASLPDVFKRIYRDSLAKCWDSKLTKQGRSGTLGPRWATGKESQGKNLEGTLNKTLKALVSHVEEADVMRIALVRSICVHPVPLTLNNVTDKGKIGAAIFPSLVEMIAGDYAWRLPQDIRYAVLDILGETIGKHVANKDLLRTMLPARTIGGLLAESSDRISDTIIFELAYRLVPITSPTAKAKWIDELFSPVDFGTSAFKLRLMIGETKGEEWFTNSILMLDLIAKGNIERSQAFPASSLIHACKELYSPAVTEGAKVYFCRDLLASIVEQDDGDGYITESRLTADFETVKSSSIQYFPDHTEVTLVLDRSATYASRGPLAPSLRQGGNEVRLQFTLTVADRNERSRLLQTLKDRAKRYPRLEPQIRNNVAAPSKHALDPKDKKAYQTKSPICLLQPTADGDLDATLADGPEDADRSRARVEALEATLDELNPTSSVESGQKSAKEASLASVERKTQLTVAAKATVSQGHIDISASKLTITETKASPILPERNSISKKSTSATLTAAPDYGRASSLPKRLAGAKPAVKPASPRVTMKTETMSVLSSLSSSTYSSEETLETLKAIGHNPEALKTKLLPAKTRAVKAAHAGDSIDEDLPALGDRSRQKVNLKSQAQGQSGTESSDSEIEIVDAAKTAGKASTAKVSTPVHEATKKAALKGLVGKGLRSEHTDYEDEPMLTKVTTEAERGDATKSAKRSHKKKTIVIDSTSTSDDGDEDEPEPEVAPRTTVSKTTCKPTYGTKRLRHPTKSNAASSKLNFGKDESSESSDADVKRIAPIKSKPSKSFPMKSRAAKKVLRLSDGDDGDIKIAPIQPRVKKSDRGAGQRVVASGEEIEIATRESIGLKRRLRPRTRQTLAGRGESDAADSDASKSVAKNNKGRVKSAMPSKEKPTASKRARVEEAVSQASSKRKKVAGQNATDKVESLVSSTALVMHPALSSFPDDVEVVDADNDSRRDETHEGNHKEIIRFSQLVRQPAQGSRHSDLLNDRHKSPIDAIDPAQRGSWDDFGDNFVVADAQRDQQGAFEDHSAFEYECGFNDQAGFDEQGGFNDHIGFDSPASIRDPLERTPNNEDKGRIGTLNGAVESDSRKSHVNKSSSPGVNAVENSCPRVDARLSNSKQRSTLTPHVLPHLATMRAETLVPGVNVNEDSGVFEATSGGVSRAADHRDFERSPLQLFEAIHDFRNSETCRTGTADQTRVDNKRVAHDLHHELHTAASQTASDRYMQEAEYDAAPIVKALPQKDIVKPVQPPDPSMRNRVFPEIEKLALPHGPEKQKAPPRSKIVSFISERDRRASLARDAAIARKRADRPSQQRQPGNAGKSDEFDEGRDLLMEYSELVLGGIRHRDLRRLAKREETSRNLESVVQEVLESSSQATASLRGAVNTWAKQQTDGQNGMLRAMKQACEALKALKA